MFRSRRIKTHHNFNSIHHMFFPGAKINCQSAHLFQRNYSRPTPFQTHKKLIHPSVNFNISATRQKNSPEKDKLSGPPPVQLSIQNFAVLPLQILTAIVSATLIFKNFSSSGAFTIDFQGPLIDLLQWITRQLRQFWWMAQITLTHNTFGLDFNLHIHLVNSAN